ncbi:MAG: BatA and WFA domain-containing protein [Candidatus Riflebacteria bacterium]|nr:BatA and WFA domain-containing protein [Candidatus Riflebacteria bacterium]
MMPDFLNPGFFWALGLLLPVFVLYFIKSRPRHAAVSSNIIWRIVISRLKPNSFFQRFQNSLFLILQLLAVTWAVFAMTRPLLNGGVGLTRLIIIDASASMQAVDVLPSRWEAARARARDLIKTWNGRTGLLVLTDRLRSVVSPVEDGNLVRGALDRLSPTHAATPSPERVLRMIRDLEGLGADELFLLTDTIDLKIPPDFLPQTAMSVEIFGTKSGNVAIVGAETIWNPAAGSIGGNLFVRNTNAETVEVEIRIACSGTSALPLKIKLAGDTRIAVPLPPLIPPATFTLSVPDASNISKADDCWYLSDPGLRPRVAIDAPAGSILYRLRRALPLVEFLSLTDNPDAASDSAAVISIGPGPAEARDRPSAAFFPGNSGDPGVAPGEIISWEEEHPLLAFTNWDVIPGEALRPFSDISGLSLVDAVGGTLVSEMLDTRGDRHFPHVSIAFDPDHPAFRGEMFLPVLLFNLVEYLLQNDFPRLWYPVGHPGMAALWHGRPPETAGFHSPPGKPGSRLAINLQAPSEAILTPAPAKPPNLAQKVGRRVKDQAGSPWQAILSIAFVCVLFEWYLYLRRY